MASSAQLRAGRASDAAMLNDLAHDEFRSARGDGKANALSGAKDCSVDANHFAGRGN